MKTRKTRHTWEDHMKMGLRETEGLVEHKNTFPFKNNTVLKIYF
jgi:hypothetical protein